ncbi:MAG: hypothetical protein QNK23_09190 [Crocinitomicaceae bacterium]|nr:hypothetical protein [Crocinitomicaceae bacterium]
MLKSFTIFFLIFQFSAIGQSDTLINSEKHGKWIYFGNDRPDSMNFIDTNDYINVNETNSGYHIEYRSDSTKFSEGQYEDDRKVGLWIYYYEDGISVKRKITLKNNRPDGLFEIYWQNGHIKESGTFARNKYSGSRTRYFESGCVNYEALYNNEGHENGSVKFYYDCDSVSLETRGQIEFEYTSKSGIPVGKAYRYFENGDIHETIIYGNDGQVISKK